MLLPVSYLMMSLSSEGQHLSTNQISSTYLNPGLRMTSNPDVKVTLLFDTNLTISETVRDCRDIVTMEY